VDADVTQIYRLLGSFGLLLGKILMLHVKDEALMRRASMSIPKSLT